MAYADVNGTRLYYEDSGPGETGETILFSHGLLWSTALWTAQIAHLKRRYRCIAYDHRGQGRSDDSTESSISIETCYADAVALIQALELGPVHVCGLSMGGFVAMRIGARRPDLARSLMLLETSCDPEPRANVPKYRLLNLIARWFGLEPVAGQVMPILFGKTSLGDPLRAAERAAWRSRLVGNRRSIWRAVNGVIDRIGVAEEIPAITCPTLVIVGDEDVATVPAKAQRIAALIPGARLVTIPRAGHSSSVEQPDAVNAALDAFLAGLPRKRRRKKPAATGQKAWKKKRAPAAPKRRRPKAAGLA